MINLNDLLCLLDRDSLLDLDHLANRSACGGLDLLIIESLERNAAFDELALQDVVHIAELCLVLGRQHQVLVLQLDRRVAAFEIEPLRDLFCGLVVSRS